MENWRLSEFIPHLTKFKLLTMPSKVLPYLTVLQVNPGFPQFPRLWLAPQTWGACAGCPLCLKCSISVCCVAAPTSFRFLKRRLSCPSHLPHYCLPQESNPWQLLSMTGLLHNRGLLLCAMSSAPQTAGPPDVCEWGGCKHTIVEVRLMCEGHSQQLLCLFIIKQSQIHC
jgi:hypothetical protein